MYEVERNGNDSNEDTALDALDSPEPPITFTFDSESDSVDDGDFYVRYPIFNNGGPTSLGSHPSPMQQRQRISLSKTVTKISDARRIRNACTTEEMNRDDFYEAREAYAAAIKHTPEEYKRKIIRELDLFIASQPYEQGRTDYEIQKALRMARDERVLISTRRSNYCYAIVNTCELTAKSDLKQEYNRFWNTVRGFPQALVIADIKVNK